MIKSFLIFLDYSSPQKPNFAGKHLQFQPNPINMAVLLEAEIKV